MTWHTWRQRTGRVSGTWADVVKILHANKHFSSKTERTGIAGAINGTTEAYFIDEEQQTCKELVRCCRVGKDTARSALEEKYHRETSDLSEIKKKNRNMKHKGKKLFLFLSIAPQKQIYSWVLYVIYTSSFFSKHKRTPCPCHNVMFPSLSQTMFVNICSHS